MKSYKHWIALLDDDEDDFVFWQHGFNLWANHVELKWFGSANIFLEFTKTTARKPDALILDGVAVRGEEPSLLSAFVTHPDLQQVAIIMLSDQFHQEEHQIYLNLGAADHLVKPNNNSELKHVILKISSHIADKGTIS